jgi:hypothetical protein
VNFGLRAHVDPTDARNTERQFAVGVSDGLLRATLV